MYKLRVAGIAAVLFFGFGVGGFNAYGEETLSPKKSASAIKSALPENAEGPRLGDWGYPLDALNRDIAPGDDFFEFANGTWLETTDIPDHRSGTGFSVSMNERVEARIERIIQDLRVAALQTGSNEQLIRDLYLSFINDTQIESAGLAPFADDLARIRNAGTHREIAGLMADATLGTGGVFGIYVGIDSKAPTRYTVWASQSGLGLPDRTYYTRGGTRLRQQRAEYVAYIAQMLDLLGEEDAERRAEAVMALETSIARKHWSKAKRRDITRTYNRASIAELQRAMPDYPWADHLRAAGIDGADSLVMREAGAFPHIARIFAETDPRIWRDYLLFHYASANAKYMPQAFAVARFDFFGETLKGQLSQRSREERAIGFVDDMLGQAVGQIYVERYFTEESKLEVAAMFENVRTAFSRRIETLDWMTPATKEAAQEKLAAMTAKIGYPDTWRDYSGLEISSTDLIGNIRRIRAFSRASNSARLGTRVDESEWTRGPQTVNAFYSHTRNEVFIPAGYIQSPLYDPAADSALNYGAMGSVIGHEIGHGFDDRGAHFDAEGRMRNWWAAEDRIAFEALGDKLAAQFSAYEPLPGLMVNGRQTLGENIGDIAGVTLAFDAYLLSIGDDEPPVLDGFTGPQRVFLGRAQGRRYKRREDSLRRRILSDNHSPVSLRVNGMIRNMDAWYDVFDIQPTDKLYLPPEDRVKIW